jgi:hypothetical protein
MKKSIHTIRTTHTALFKRKAKAICPIFDTKLAIQCQICGECDLDLCLHNTDLKNAHLSLRNAIRQHQAESRQVVHIMGEHHAENLRAANKDIRVMDENHVKSQQAAEKAILDLDKQHAESRQAATEGIRVMDEHHAKRRQAAEEGIRVMNEQHAERRQAAEEGIRVMNEQHAESRQAANKAIRIMDDLVGPLSKNFKRIDLIRLETHLIMPPPSEETVSIAKQLNFDAVSVDTQSSNDGERSLSPDIDVIGKRPGEELSKAARRKRRFNEMIIEGVRGCGYEF